MTRAKRMTIGDLIATRDLVTIRGVEAIVPDPTRLVHLQFRRFAGCPACNLHLQSFNRRLHEISAAGIREVVVFHSSETALRRDLAETAIDVVADPSKRLYAEFGVERSLRSILDPRAWGAFLRGLFRRLASLPARGESALGLPADFLVAPDGLLIACKYGAHADDQWSVDELLAIGATDTTRRLLRDTEGGAAG